MPIDSAARRGMPAPAGASRRRRSLVSAALLAPWCARAQPRGSTDDDILLGQSCQLTGPLAALTSEVRAGAQLHFDDLNRTGGVGGRRVRVVALDDAYDPRRTVENTHRLIGQDQVVALFQFAGTPGSLAAAPIAQELRVPFFAPFTGSDALRETFNSHLFNVKAGYGDELEAMVRQLATVGMRKLSVAYLNNAFGTGGLAQVERSASRHGVELLSRVPLEVDSSRLAPAVAQTAAQRPPAVILVSAGKPGVDFIDAYLRAGHRSTFYMLSVTSNTQLVKALGERARGIVVSQVMPSPWKATSRVVREFQALARAAGLADFTFSQMEGFVSALALTEALRRAGRALTRDSLVRAIESMQRVDLGGYIVDLSPTRHSSGSFVDLLILGADGRFRS